jgi:hypothetical protein
MVRLKKEDAWLLAHELKKTLTPDDILWLQQNGKIRIPPYQKNYWNLPKNSCSCLSWHAVVLITEMLIAKSTRELIPPNKAIELCREHIELSAKLLNIDIGQGVGIDQITNLLLKGIEERLREQEKITLENDPIQVIFLFHYFIAVKILSASAWTTSPWYSAPWSG